ncbi:Dam family site-specific DNA-(adenine-N6)-methyltransferase [Providencia alcalifaciens]|uniref:site-specific DNA-methyltransferase (adenine-specific) n=1 Tax=Providencia alcalifaciens TaxID=126385 RepID=A0AAW9VA74_9GAMM|nr:Dam family site-specific DNA-(adenine-N6)-methyltransferase [Providencia alcalifaciens]
MAKSNKTILKWAGSKVGVMEQLRPHLPKTKRLVEPFAGSCAVMMNTDYERYLIADANPDLINLYNEIISMPAHMFSGEAAELFGYAVDNESIYYWFRAEFNTKKSELNAVENACLFLYLNRHCFNGLCRYNKKGEFNVPFGKLKKPYFPEKEIVSFSEKAMRADIVCLEWQDTLSLVDFGDGVYCDPPYMGDGFTRYHTAGFSDEDQEALAKTLKDINSNQGNPVTVSNSIAAKELYLDLGFAVHEIEAPRKISANGNRKSATEIIAVLGALQ